jgi:aspartate 1-decarboxylase
MNTEYRRVLRSKIHRATVTEANLDYEGSITIPRGLMDAAELSEYEAVQLWNVTRGTRLETYVIEGERDSQEICVNGAAAHLMQKGDIIIIANFSSIPLEKLSTHRPTVVFVDGGNHIQEIRVESAERNKASLIPFGKNNRMGFNSPV